MLLEQEHGSHDQKKIKKLLKFFRPQNQVTEFVLPDFDEEGIGDRHEIAEE